MTSSIEIVPLGPEHHGAVRRFVAETWERPDSDAFFRWRYDEAPGLVGFLAMRGGECLAMECAFRRPYLIRGKVVHLLETFDWYSLPAVRQAGLGVRLMQQFMKGADPLLLVGGSKEAVDLLARMKWRPLTPARRFMRRIGGSDIARAAARRLRLPGAVEPLLEVVASPFLRPRRRFAPRDGRALPTASVGEEALALYRGAVAYEMLPLWTPESLRWLTAGFPGAGHYVPFYFARGDSLVGWALLRIFELNGSRRAEILELFTPRADPDLLAWMISEASCCAAGFDPEWIATSTTCPAVAAALRRNAFVEIEALPVQWWWPGGDAPPETLLLGSNTRDTPINPYPPRWWNAGANG